VRLEPLRQVGLQADEPADGAERRISPDVGRQDPPAAVLADERRWAVVAVHGAATPPYGTVPQWVTQYWQGYWKLKVSCDERLTDENSARSRLSEISLSQTHGTPHRRRFIG
jgi:hypothetical protein